MYAFNAQSGAVRWKPSGRRQDLRLGDDRRATSSTTPTSARKTTAGLDVRTGRQVFSFPDGAFNPVVADNGTIYLSGYSMLYQMLPNHGEADRANVIATQRS